MPLKVLPATDEDAPRSFEIEHLAYQATNDPINDLLFPGPMPPDANEKRAEGLLKLKQESPYIVWLKVVDEELDLMIAFAEWHIYETEVPKAKKRTFGPGSNPQVCDEFFGALATKTAELMGKQPHVCRSEIMVHVCLLTYIVLKFLHTDPAHQKRGAGGMLIKWGLEKAKELKLPAYLEASPAGKPLYIKHGFHEIGRSEFDLQKWGGGDEIETVVYMLHPYSDAGSAQT